MDKIESPRSQHGNNPALNFSVNLTCLKRETCSEPFLLTQKARTMSENCYFYTLVSQVWEDPVNKGTKNDSLKITKT